MTTLTAIKQFFSSSFEHVGRIFSAELMPLNRTLIANELGEIPDKTAIKIAGSTFDEDNLIVIQSISGRKIYTVRNVWLEVEAYNDQ